MANHSSAREILGWQPEAKNIYWLASVGATIAGAAAVTNVRGVITAVLGVLGLLVAGVAVSRRPKDTFVLGIASLTAALAWLATSEEWDAIRIMMAVMSGVAGAGALLLLLPRTLQRIAISVFVLYHFCGILTAITSPAPTPWITAQLWTRLFRPHLEFCYVNNAYQFYSPQPGPANILWVCIIGDDDRAEWLKMPQRAEHNAEKLDPLSVEYFRRLSLTERANQNVQLPLGPPAEVMQARYGTIIPMLPDLLPTQQYRMPNEHARQIIASYARHVAKTWDTGRPGVKIKSLKIYLTLHRMLSQKEFANGWDPFDPSTYWPFFVGEFDIEGVLRNANDPMLYWVVPILPGPQHGYGQAGSETVDLRNYVKDHAGSDPLERP